VEDDVAGTGDCVGGAGEEQDVNGVHGGVDGICTFPELLNQSMRSSLMMISYEYAYQSLIILFYPRYARLF
jgi:hypothetical protein